VSRKAVVFTIILLVSLAVFFGLFLFFGFKTKHFSHDRKVSYDLSASHPEITQRVSKDEAFDVFIEKLDFTPTNYVYDVNESDVNEIALDRPIKSISVNITGTPGNFGRFVDEINGRRISVSSRNIRYNQASDELIIDIFINFDRLKSSSVGYNHEMSKIIGLHLIDVALTSSPIPREYSASAEDAEKYSFSRHQQLFYMLQLILAEHGPFFKVL